MKPSRTIGIIGTIAFVGCVGFLVKSSMEQVQDNKSQEELRIQKMKILKQKIVEAKSTNAGEGFSTEED